MVVLIEIIIVFALIIYFICKCKSQKWKNHAHVERNVRLIAEGNVRSFAEAQEGLTKIQCRFVKPYLKRKNDLAKEVQDENAHVEQNVWSIRMKPGYSRSKCENDLTEIGFKIEGTTSQSFWIKASKEEIQNIQLKYKEWVDSVFNMDTPVQVKTCHD